jgi:hypothetical protein
MFTLIQKAKLHLPDGIYAIEKSLAKAKFLYLAKSQ